MRVVLALVAGVLFGIGLITGGMTNPAKVKAFLDLYGRWDPSLGMVMAGAIPIAAVAFAIARWRKTSWGGRPIMLPPRRGIDWKLVVGALLFGAGWGLVGFCPGPAIVAAASGYGPAVAFLPAMLVGIVLHDELAQGFRDAW